MQKRVFLEYFEFYGNFSQILGLDIPLLMSK